MINGDIKIKSNLIPRIFPSLKKAVIDSFNVTSVNLVHYLKEERFTGGTTESRLGVRSGKLRTSVRPLAIKATDTIIESGVNFGTVYARTHVGPSRQVTTIRPKTSQYLSIPLDAAKKPSGVPKGSPRTGPWGETFFARSKKGNLILFGKAAYSKGSRQGETHGKVVPLFLMAKQIKVKARIHPSEIVAYTAPILMKMLRGHGIKIQ